MEHEGLGRLEQIVDKLLLEYAGLKQEKERLEQALTARDREINELRERSISLQEEKNMIYERVSSMLTSLEKWEESQVRLSQPSTNVVAPDDLGPNSPKSPEAIGAGA